MSQFARHCMSTSTFPAPALDGIRAVIHDADSSRWLRFHGPVKVIEAYRPGDVDVALNSVQDEVECNKYFAAGFVSYECGAALDAAIRAQPAGEFPLVWFGLFRDCAQTDAPRGGRGASWHPEWKSEVDKEEYTRSIRAIKGLLAAGETYQVNYTYRLRAPFAVEPYAYFTQVASNSNLPYAAFLEYDKHAICSFSPELLFRLDGKEIYSKPMKGTMARGQTAEDDLAKAQSLRNSEKNRAENIMIVDMVRNDLARIAAPGSVSVPALCDVEKYDTVWQMISTVRAKTSASFAGIMKALFPPASCTGAPKVRTAGIIAGLEKSPRRIYTGSIGYLAPGRKMQFNVAIRTVLIDKSAATAEYGVGGGIVWDSTASDEFDECAVKARVVCAASGGHALLETMLWDPRAGFYLLDLHLARLKASAGFFSFPFNEEALRAKLESFAGGLAPARARVRLILERDGALKLEAHLLSRDTLKTLSICPAKYPVDSGSVYLYHKTTYRQVYEKAKAERPGYDEVVLWNARGEVTEFCAGNIIVKLGGEWLTPPVKCGLLPGVFRAWLLQKGLVRERVITLDLLSKCEKIYFCNSVRKIRVAHLGKRAETLLKSGF